VIGIGLPNPIPGTPGTTLVEGACRRLARRSSSGRRHSARSAWTSRSDPTIGTIEQLDLLADAIR
jgi:hypothetical protein